MIKFFLRTDNSKKEEKNILAYEFSNIFAAISWSSETLKNFKHKRRLNNIKEG